MTNIDLYDNIPPGNINNTNLSINYKQTYNYNNDFTFNNLSTLTSVTIPSYTFIESTTPTDKCNYCLWWRMG